MGGRVTIREQIVNLLTAHQFLTLDELAGYIMQEGQDIGFDEIMEAPHSLSKEEAIRVAINGANHGRSIIGLTSGNLIQSNAVLR